MVLEVLIEQELLGKDFKVYGDFESPLFLAKDVSEWIEYSEGNTSHMCSMLDKDEVKKIFCSINGTKPTESMAEANRLFITEDGLYEVLMQSRKPIAKEFKRQVKEILKTIRKTGGYVVENRAIDFVSNWLPNLDDMSKSVIAGMLEDNQKLRLENTKQKEVIEVQKPKADYFDALVDTNLLTNFRDTAKELKVKEGKFIEFLLEKGYVYRDKRGKLKPVAQYVDVLFELKEFTNGKFSDTQTRVTPRGRETFRLLIDKFLK